MKDDGAVRIPDLTNREPERDVRISRLSLFGVAPLDPHSLPLYVPNCFSPASCGNARIIYVADGSAARGGTQLSPRPASPLLLSATPTRRLKPGLVIYAPGASLEAKPPLPRGTTARSISALYWRARPTSLPARRTLKS